MRRRGSAWRSTAVTAISGSVRRMSAMLVISRKTNRSHRDFWERETGQSAAKCASFVNTAVTAISGSVRRIQPSFSRTTRGNRSHRDFWERETVTGMFFAGSVFTGNRSHRDFWERETVATKFAECRVVHTAVTAISGSVRRSILKCGS